MRTLNRALARHRFRRDERGVSMVLFALFFVVMIIVAALVVDVGALQAEKRELQNGADAAALDLAIQCLLGGKTSDCYVDDVTAATDIAQKNANDNLTAVDDVRYGTTSLGAPKVTVDTSTATDSGTILPFSFAQVFTGSDGQTVHASATAAWGSLVVGETPALAIAYCDWWLLTDGGTRFDGSNPFLIRMLDHRGLLPPTDCSLEPGYPTEDYETEGGFAWLAPPPGECLFEVEVGSRYTAYVDSSYDPPVGCRGAGNKLDSVFDDPEVLVAVYGEKIGSTQPYEFEIVGFAVVEVYLYSFPPQYYDPIRNGCGIGPNIPTTHCFAMGVKEYTVSGTPGGGAGIPDLGVTAVSLVNESA